MKKFKTLSLVAILVLLNSANAQINFTTYPVSKERSGISRGGDIPDSVALQDGVGTLLINGIKKNKELKNNEYNDLLIENKKEIENNNLKDLVNDNIIINEDNNLDTIINPIFFTLNEQILIPQDGTPCDTDDNPCTLEKYTNGVCTNYIFNTTNTTHPTYIFLETNGCIEEPDNVVTFP